MIDFSLGDDLELIQETALRFATDQLVPHDRTFEADRGVSRQAWEAYAETGLALLELPEELDGAGLGALARVVVLEELAAADAGAALALDPFGPALYPLLELGGVEALRTLALPLLEKSARAVLAWDPDAALRVEDGRVSGVLPWVPADQPELLVVLRREGAFAVQEGLHCEVLRGAGLRAAGAGELQLDAAPLCGSWDGEVPAARALARARLYVTALLVGVMRRSADFSREYALERQAFGRPIAHHQALAFLIADLATAVEGSRCLLWEAAWRLERGEGEPADQIETCASAFVEAVEQSGFVTPNAVQILGGHGFMQDYPVEKWMREARALGLLLGGVDAAREEAGRRLRLIDGQVELTSGAGPR